MTSETILLRTDSGPEIGTGHLMRCLALAQVCRAKGMSPLFVLALVTPLEERLRQEGMEVVHVVAKRGSGADAEELLRIASERSARWICLDGYAFDAAYQTTVRTAGLPLLVIDDYSHLPAYDCDVLLNQNIDAKSSMFKGKTDARLLLGPTYALLRKEFLIHSDVQRAIPDEATKVLVTLGGTNIGNPLPIVCEALSHIQFPLDIHMILGGADEAALKKILAPSPHRVMFIPYVTDMPQRMAWADLAISAAGSTSWELLFMGLPFVTGIVAENQKGIAEELDRLGLAQSVGWYKDVSPERLAGEIELLAGDVELRKRMSQLGKKTVDGRGAERVANVMESFV